MKDWTDFKKSFTQKQEDALWQYFIDHSKVQANGYFLIMFYCQNIDDFWRRLYARYTGDFHRYEIEEKEVKLERAFGESMSLRVQWIDEYGSLKQKINLWLFRKTRRYLQRMGDPKKNRYIKK